VYESVLPQIRIGAPVEIAVAAYADRVFPAHISAVNPTIDPATRTLRVRCLVANSGGLLRPEMFATIRIGGGLKRKVPTVPTPALITQGSDSYVLTEDSAGRFRKRKVKPARDANGYTIIEQGLTAGDRVVTSGVLLLTNMLGGK
jgi:RND family efflux transporter MFP subunit